MAGSEDALYQPGYFSKKMFALRRISLLQGVAGYATIAKVNRDGRVARLPGLTHVILYAWVGVTQLAEQSTYILETWSRNSVSNRLCDNVPSLRA